MEDFVKCLVGVSLFP